MSVADEYEEAKLAKQRASMTLAEWVAEVKDEYSPEWLAMQVADPQTALETIAKSWKKDGFGQIINTLEDVFGPPIEAEAKRRKHLAEDEYEEQYGRRV